MNGGTIGIDPGCTGAIALLDSGGTILDIVDMPSVEKGVASPELVKLHMERLHEKVGLLGLVVVERVSAMPKQGVASSFKFGVSYGIALGAGAMTGARMINPTPSRWKKDLGLSKDKKASLAMAVRLWPESASYFTRVMDADRAEAALLAHWGRRFGATL